MVPQAKRFDVKARFTSGLVFYDKAYMYTDVNALRKVLGISNQQSYDGVHVYSENAFKDVEKLKSYLKSDYAVVGGGNKIKTSFLLLSLKKERFLLF